MAINRKPIFDAVRGILIDRGGPGFSDTEVKTLDRAFDAAEGITHPVQVGLTTGDFAAAASRLGCSVAQIRAVWEVECSGNGWFTDIRGDILSLDGPGGFIDGTALPKILFEAHIFARETRGRFNKTAPNLSSPTWNRRLYVGGQGEWERLWKAMLLDRKAALMSASVGAPQIMGFNYAKAGFATVEEFWDAMKESEVNQLNAFVSFIINSKLADELRACTSSAASCRAFALGYNGEGYAANNYHGKIAAAVKQWS